MIDSTIHANKKDSCVRPFLMRFAQKCTSEDAVSGDKQPPPRTFFTEVRRETTDDR